MNLKFHSFLALLMTLCILAACSKGISDIPANNDNTFTTALKGKTWVESKKDGNTSNFSMKFRLNADTSGVYTYLSGINNQFNYVYDSFPIFWRVDASNNFTARHTTGTQDGIGGFKIHFIKDSMMGVGLGSPFYPDTVYFKRTK